MTFFYANNRCGDCIKKHGFFYTKKWQDCCNQSSCFQVKNYSSYYQYSKWYSSYYKFVNWLSYSSGIANWIRVGNWYEDAGIGSKLIYTWSEKLVCPK